jgi:hypothetical protein
MGQSRLGAIRVDCRRKKGEMGIRHGVVFATHDEIPDPIRLRNIGDSERNTARANRMDRIGLSMAKPGTNRSFYVEL